MRDLEDETVGKEKEQGLGRKRESNRGGMVYLFGMSIWGGEKE